MSNTEDNGAIDNVETDLIPESDDTLSPAQTPEPKSIRSRIAEAIASTDGDDPDTEPAVDRADTKLKAPLLKGAAAPELKPGQELDPLTGRVLDPVNAPASMSPAMREKWGTVPRDFQKMWVDRDRHINEVLKQTNDVRTFAKQFKELTAPYEPMLKHYNISAVDHAKELFHLSHSLVSGTPDQRAQLYGDLFRAYPPNFDVLVKMSQGQPVNVQRVQTAQAPLDLDAEVDRRIAERQSKQNLASSQGDIDAFASDPGNPYFKDVQHMMGRIIQDWVEIDPTVEERPLPELLKDAYELACQQHPEIRAILSRANAPAGGQNAAVAASQRAPAATAPAAPQQRAIPSVKPSLSSGAKSKAPVQKRDVRDIISEAMEADGFN